MIRTAVCERECRVCECREWEESVLQVSFYYLPAGKPAKPKTYYHEGTPFGGILFHIVG